MNPFPFSARQQIQLAGGSWPAHYGDPEEEYRAVTAAAGLLDLSPYEWLRATGPDTEGFLQGMVTQNIHAMKPREALPAWVLESSGKIVALVHIYRLAAQDFLIQTPPGQGDQLLRTLDRYLIMEEVNLRPEPDRHAFSLQGPMVKEMRTAWDAPEEACSWFEHDRCGHGGHDLLFQSATAEKIAEAIADLPLNPVGAIALNRARVEAFLPWFGVDMKAGVNPMVYGAANRISARKGCYIGQETVAMTRDRGRPPMLLVWLSCPNSQTPEQDMALLADGKPVGELTSAIFSPERASWLGIGTVKYARAEPGSGLKDKTDRTWTVLKNAQTG